MRTTPRRHTATSSTHRLQLYLFFASLTILLYNALRQQGTETGREILNLELLDHTALAKQSRESILAKDGGEQSHPRLQLHQGDDVSAEPITVSATNSNEKQQQQPELNKALFDCPKLNIESVWRSILHRLPNATSRNVVEIGMHTAAQCLQGARAGFDVHCIEPSPTSFDRVLRAFRRHGRNFKFKVMDQRPWLKRKKQKRVHYPVRLYNFAAGNVSGQQLYFHASGGTGDHVVSESVAKRSSNVTQVMSLRMDDLIRHLDSNILALKLDVQGFEPIVLEGLVESLTLKRIDFLLMEVWPKAMAAGSCPVALQRFRDAGYTLYPLYKLMAHPYLAPPERRMITERPYTTLKEFCEWYLHVDDRLPNGNYTFGYWTDLVAVSPNVINGQERMTLDFWNTFLAELPQF